MGPWLHRLLGTARQLEVTIPHFEIWELVYSQERVVRASLDFLLKMLLAAAGTLPVPKGVTGDLLFPEMRAWLHPVARRGYQQCLSG